MTAKLLKISDTRSLPVSAVTQTIGFIARRGAGKTYAAQKIVEQLLGAGALVVVLDPVGNWYGLRLAADGKGKGLPIPVLGGLHGDLPLVADAGRLVAELVMGRGMSAVLDVSAFRKADRKRFVTDFAERLYELAKVRREPLHVVFEEAQVFAPQHAGHGEERMLGAIEDIVRLGRNYGLGSTLITQRPQSVNKEVLNQVECLFVGQLSGAHERKAIDAWVVHNADAAKVDTRALPSLPVGTMFLWSPQWLGVFEKVRIAAKATYDASATPELGKVHVARELSPVDLVEIRGALEEATKRVQDDDPRLLRKRLAEANATIKKLEQKADAASDAEEVEAIKRSFNTKWSDLRTQLNKMTAALEGAQAGLRQVLLDMKADPVPAGKRRPQQAPAKVVVHHAPPARLAPTARPVPPDGQRVSKAERGVLIALAQHGPLSLVQAAIIAGYSSSSSTMRNAAGALRSGGLVSGGNECMNITSVGLDVLGPYDPLPVGAALAEYWYTQLSKSEREMLRTIVGEFPDTVSLAQAAEPNGYSASSSTARNAAGRLRSLMLVEGGNDAMRASERLVD